MKISIVTCTRNSMAFLPETVASVQAQTGVDYEHIFVDGNSTDGTLEYIRSLPGNVTLLRGVTGGIGRAMNEGIQAAGGDAICHLHSDDYFLHGRVLHRVATHFRDSGAEWLFGRVLSDVDGSLVPESYIPPAWSYSRMLRGNFIPHPATFVRKRLFDRMGLFNESFRYAMDYEYWLRIGRAYSPLALREAFSVFRRHDGSTTQANRLASLEEDYKARRLYAAGMRERLRHAAYYRVRRNRLLRVLAQAVAG